MSRGQWIARHHGQGKADEFQVDPGPMSWLLEMLYDAGTIKREWTMNGPETVPLGWAEIVAWIEGSQQHDIAPFWRREVMRLSGEVARQMQISSETACDAPFDPGKDD